MIVQQIESLWQDWSNGVGGWDRIPCQIGSFRIYVCICTARQCAFLF